MKEAKVRRVPKRGNKKMQRRRDLRSQKIMDAKKLKELNGIVQQQQNAQFRGETHDNLPENEIAPELKKLAAAPAPHKKDIEMPSDLLSELKKM